MNKYIVYSNKKYECLKIAFTQKNEIKDFLVTIIDLQLPLVPIDANNWEFVVLELLTNAHRASMEKNTDGKIVLTLKIEGDYFTTSVTDSAGGFDINSLPYDISLPADKIDVFSSSFEEYRLKNDYKRFGLGLFSAKKFGEFFDIYFINAKGERLPEYKPKETLGTVILFKKKIKEG